MADEGRQCLLQSVCVSVCSEVGCEGLSGNEAEEVSPIGWVQNLRVKNIPTWKQRAEWPPGAAASREVARETGGEQGGSERVSSGGTGGLVRGAVRELGSRGGRRGGLGKQRFGSRAGEAGEERLPQGSPSGFAAWAQLWGAACRTAMETFPRVFS